MNFNTIHHTNEHTLLRVISGSIAYGLNTSTSDTDIRGVYMQPKQLLYSLNYQEQYNDDKNDIVYYELKKMMSLLLGNNPNTLDLIATPPSCILYQHPIMQQLEPSIFLSKLCYKSFAGYALTQLQNARGLNKKILQPMAKERQGLLDFCWVGNAQGSISLQHWLHLNNYSTAQCGCIAIPHMKNCYHLFIGNNYKGITDKDNVQIMLSSVEKNILPATTFYCNIEGFQKYCVTYNAYWKWVSNRNQARYQSTIEHGKQYDAKNMMHTFRLLYMAIDIATEGQIIVHRKERKRLLEIRNGNFEYTDLVHQANHLLEQVKYAFDKSPLPEEPNKLHANNLLIAMREQWYANNN